MPVRMNIPLEGLPIELRFVGDVTCAQETVRHGTMRLTTN